MTFVGILVIFRYIRYMLILNCIFTTPKYSYIHFNDEKIEDQRSYTEFSEYLAEP